MYDFYNNKHNNGIIRVITKEHTQDMEDFKTLMCIFCHAIMRYEGTARYKDHLREYWNQVVKNTFI